VSLRHTLNAIVAAIIAPPCAVCHRVLDTPLDGAVCGPCWQAIVPRGSGFALHLISQGRAIGPYESTLRDVVHALKYDKRRSIAVHLSALMAIAGCDVLRGADLVVPVPLHRRRQRERGFNQAEELARHLPLPMLRALTRVKATPSQIDLPADERRDNVRDAFGLRRAVIGRSAIGWSVPVIGPSNARPLQGYTVVIVDDVATTGATLEACARVLKSAGAADIRALTAARVSSGPWRTPPR
jgi:predicted amidophosphoribosyltransferase